MAYDHKAALEYIWSKTDVRGPDECWPWSGSIEKTSPVTWGYRVNRALFNADKKQIQVLRIVHEVLGTPMMGPGRTVRRYCGNNLCMNPAHSTPSTRAELKFWTKVQKGAPDECWEWLGSKDRDGYGIATVARLPVRAHRFSYELANGPIPSGLVIDHFGCSNRGCVNPAHLAAITPRQNSLRSDVAPSAVNAGKLFCKHGHPFSKENTRIVKRTTRSHTRQCKTCAAASGARYYERRAQT